MIKSLVNHFLIKLIILISVCLGFGIPVFSQDQIINARNINIQITNPSGPAGTIAWSSINNAYILAPLGPDYGFCISVINNNPTNAHTYSVSAFQTGDSAAVDYTHNQARYAPLTIVGSPSPVPASSTNTFFIRSNGAAKIAFVFSGSTTQAGNPDTVDIYAVQTTASGCGTVNPQTGQQYTLATPNSGTSSAPPIMAVSDGLSLAFVNSFNAVNPAGNFMLMSVNVNNGNRTIYFDKLILSCSALCSLNVIPNINIGNTCTVNSLTGNLKLGSGVTSIATVIQDPCTSHPNLAPFNYSVGFIIGSGQSLTLDLKGLIAPNGTTNGIEIVNTAAVTGNVSGTILWYEK